MYKVEREAILKEIGERWMNNMKRGSLNLDTSMLLGPKFSRQLSADDDWKIKRSLFNYIHATGKEL